MRKICIERYRFVVVAVPLSSLHHRWRLLYEFFFQFNLIWLNLQYILKSLPFKCNSWCFNVSDKQNESNPDSQSQTEGIIFVLCLFKLLVADIMHLQQTIYTVLFLESISFQLICVTQICIDSQFFQFRIWFIHITTFEYIGFWIGFLSK